MGRHYSRKVDDNQPDVVRQLRRVPGLSVTPTHQVGGGFPDLCVGWRGRNLLVELKDPRKIPSKRALTKSEQEWHKSWPGEAIVAETAQDIMVALGIDVRAVPAEEER